MVPSSNFDKTNTDKSTVERSMGKNVEALEALKKPGKVNQLAQWVAKGTPWVWLNAGAVTISVLMVLGLVGLIASRGLVYFWPDDIVRVELKRDLVQQGEVVTWAGSIWSEEVVPASRLSNDVVPEGQEEVRRYLLKTGNRDLDGFDFRWVNDFQIDTIDYPQRFLKVERREWGNFYGVPQKLLENDNEITHENHVQLIEDFQARLDRALDLFEEAKRIEVSDIGKINYQFEKLRLQERRLELDNALTDEAKKNLEVSRVQLASEYENLEAKRREIYDQLSRDQLVALTADGREKTIPLSQIVSFNTPNTYSIAQKVGVFFKNFKNFLVEEPREANTEGGVFPAIFGTVTMVLLMSVLVTPFGVIGAVYLREYAAQGFITRTVRIAVNNLAGVPSIVYGVFGLGFFVYFLGGSIDELFYPEAAPAPVFGTPGLMWASLTLALLLYLLLLLRQRRD